MTEEDIEKMGLDELRSTISFLIEKSKKLQKDYVEKEEDIWKELDSTRKLLEFSQKRHLELQQS